MGTAATLGTGAAGSLRMPVALVGMMGSGKTAVGTAVAAALGVPFRDTDDAIFDASRMTIAEIFARDGEPFFRAREAEVLRRLLAAGPGIVSTGGGVFMDPANRAAIAAAGVAVWLRATPAILWSRVKGRTTRPLLMTEDPRGTLERLIRERTPVYAEAPLVVDAEPNLGVAAMADKVVACLAQAGAVVEAPRRKGRA